MYINHEGAYDIPLAIVCFDAGFGPGTLAYQWKAPVFQAFPKRTRAAKEVVLFDQAYF